MHEERRSIDWLTGNKNRHSSVSFDFFRLETIFASPRISKETFWHKHFQNQVGGGGTDQLYDSGSIFYRWTDWLITWTVASRVVHSIDWLIDCTVIHSFDRLIGLLGSSFLVFCAVFPCTLPEMEDALKETGFFRLPNDYTIRLRGLEWSVTPENVLDFFKGIVASLFNSPIVCCRRITGPVWEEKKKKHLGPWLNGAGHVEARDFFFHTNVFSVFSVFSVCVSGFHGDYHGWFTPRRAGHCIGSRRYFYLSNMMGGLRGKLMCCLRIKPVLRPPYNGISRRWAKGENKKHTKQKMARNLIRRFNEIRGFLLVFAFSCSVACGGMKKDTDDHFRCAVSGVQSTDRVIVFSGTGLIHFYRQFCFLLLFSGLYHQFVSVIHLLVFLILFLYGFQRGAIGWSITPLIDWLFAGLIAWLIDWLIDCWINRLIDWLIDSRYNIFFYNSELSIITPLFTVILFVWTLFLPRVSTGLCVNRFHGRFLCFS